MAKQDWLPPYEIVREEFNSLRGRTLSMIESVGLPRAQEEAIKKMVKNITFQSQFIFEEIVNTLEGEDRDVKFRYSPNSLEVDEKKNGTS